MPFVVDENGIQIQTIDEIKAELETAVRNPSPDGFGPDFVLEPTEVIPTTLAIMAEREARAQLTVKAAVDAMVPGAARGIHADNIAGITGTTRNDGTPSTVQMRLTGTPLATVEATPASPRVYQHNPTGTLWEQQIDAVIGAGGTVDITVQTQDDGPVDIVASTDWTIIVGDADLTSVESIADSALGSLVETDAELEERRKEELARAGQSTIPAIRADLQQELTELGYNVDAVAVFANLTERWVDGRPPNSVEVLVDDNGLVPDLVIAQTLFALVSGGTQTWGDISQTWVDSDGESRTIRFSRATDVAIYLRFTLDTTGAEVEIADEAGLADELADAAVAYGDTHHPNGRNVNPAAFLGTVFDTAPGGSLEGGVVAEVSDDGVSWQTTPWPIAPAEVAAFDTSRVTVVFTP